MSYPTYAPNIGNTLVEQIDDELSRAMKHGNFNSAHEGYAVLLEEVDELWDEVKKGGSQPRDNDKMRKEAIQVAAMAIKFVRLLDKRPAIVTPSQPKDYGPCTRKMDEHCTGKAADAGGMCQQCMPF